MGGQPRGAETELVTLLKKYLTLSRITCEKFGSFSCIFKTLAMNWGYWRGQHNPPRKVKQWKGPGNAVWLLTIRTSSRLIWPAVALASWISLSVMLKSLSVPRVSNSINNRKKSFPPSREDEVDLRLNTPSAVGLACRLKDSSEWYFLAEYPALRGRVLGGCLDLLGVGRHRDSCLKSLATELLCRVAE